MDEFRDAIARITIEGTAIRATGFLVGPDLVATALHVVADRTVEPPAFHAGKITLEFPGHTTVATVIPGKWNQDADCVLLQCVDAEALSTYPTIPLRELSKSDDLWKTRGYPDTQPVNGMTWDGDVTSFTGELTRSYATRKVVYGPVLQLYCRQAAAAIGALPRGLSGAPVVLGTAAVGLLCFALMEDGHAAAGTLYACHAKDIADLFPEKLHLRPPLAPIAILTQEQLTRLTELLVAAFADNLSGMRRTIRFSLGIEVERSVTPADGLDGFVPALLSILVQQGPGMVSVLLRGAIATWPEDQNLRALAQEVSPYALEPLNDDLDVQEAHDAELVTRITTALIDLNGMRRSQELQNIMASYRPDFEQTRQQIAILAKYKELHNCLHAIQERLDEIANTLERLKKGDNVVGYLKDYASFLKDLARKARNQTVGLPTADDEQGWINQLDDCAAIMKAAASPTATVDESEKVLDVSESLARILPNASDINQELVRSAQKVGLNKFAETMRSVEQQLGATMSDNSLKRLREGTLAVGRMRSRLAGLVAEHDEWQSLNTDFEYTKTRKEVQPQAKFSSWPQFKAKLMGLCDAFPQEEWSVELREMMKPWMADKAPPEPKIAANIGKLEADFAGFYKQCVDRFIEVDHELNELCKKITSFKTPLDVLLTA